MQGRSQALEVHGSAKETLHNLDIFGSLWDS